MRCERAFTPQTKLGIVLIVADFEQKGEQPCGRNVIWFFVAVYAVPAYSRCFNK